MRLALCLLLYLISLSACEPEAPAGAPAPDAASTSPAPAATLPPLPSSTPLPQPVFSQTPVSFKTIRGWKGTLKVSFNHLHTAANYSYREDFALSGPLEIIDQTTQGSFLSWPIPTGEKTWQAHLELSNELLDQQNPEAPIERRCRFSGLQSLDFGLSIKAGSYRLNGRFEGVQASCSQKGSDNAPSQPLPTMSLTENLRYWEFTEPLPAKGTTLSGTRVINLDDKNLVYSWELKPLN